MIPVDVLAFSIITGVFVAAWRDGARLARVCGVDARAARFALAWIVPNAVVIVGVHVVGLTGLIADKAILTLPVIAGVVVVVWLCVRLWIRQVVRRSGISPPPQDGVGHPDRRDDGLGAMWWPVIVLGGVYAVFLVEAVTRYPTGYDGTHYHLPTAIGWMQERAMHLSPGVPHFSSPENGMIGVLLLSYLRLEKLITLVNVPHAIVLAMTVFALSLATGAERRGAAAATCIVMGVPMVVFQSVSGYVDVFGTVFLLSSLLALYHVSRASAGAHRNALIVLAGVAGGIALGSRISFLIIVPVLVVVAIVVARRRTKDIGINRVPMAGVLGRFGVGLAACSGFWFVRGAIEAGNPFYPLEIKVADRVLLPGIDPGACFPARTIGEQIGYSAGYVWHEAKRGGGYGYGVDNGMGASFAAFVPIGMGVALCGGIRRRRVVGRCKTVGPDANGPLPSPSLLGRAQGLGSENKTGVPNDGWSVAFALMAVGGVVLLLTVYYGVVRYALPLLVLGACAAGPMLDRLIRSHRRVTVGLLTGTVALGGVVSVLKPAHGLAGRLRDGRWSRAAFYEIPEMIDALPAGARIGVVSDSATPLCYALLGKDYSNRVYSPAHVALQWSGAEAFASFDYLYVREPWPVDLPPDLSVTLIYDDEWSRAPGTTAASRIYRVDYGGGYALKPSGGAVLRGAGR